MGYAKCFSKWLSFGGDVIAENEPEEQQKRLRYNDLVASAAAFYTHPQTIEDIEDHSLGRALDCFGLEMPDMLRWSGPEIRREAVGDRRLEVPSGTQDRTYAIP
ncbi:hypothetical protein [Paraburkholderia sp. CNPSo 3281]|uniref:hypothetical protein n=1 Tax=Paraburkholderia sp. CNPSo 3281 TaxID=2940933 RepID=UPI0020B6C12E|nr:hypothetical protein [Paraburkholderia sp. CNPSo 3281]MCP3715496.1 hypothetical protein [Paraburkholderia sp. CNPSo 3281]